MHLLFLQCPKLYHDDFDDFDGGISPKIRSGSTLLPFSVVCYNGHTLIHISFSVLLFWILLSINCQKKSVN